MTIKNLEVIKWLVFSGPQNYPRVTISTKEQEDGSKLYSLETETSCYSKKLNTFIIEPSPSNRDSEYLQETRFKTPDEALQAWNKFINSAPKNHFIKKAYDGESK